MKKLKLTIELVPSTVWYSSLYRLLPNNMWRKLRKEIGEKEGWKCWICGSTTSPLELHEFWKYDEKKRVQKLVGMHLLCRLCHMIKHIGFWCYTKDGKEKLKKMGLSREDLIKHFCKVNGCSKEDFYRHEEEAFSIWEQRSKIEWKQDFGKYKRYLSRLNKWF